MIKRTSEEILKKLHELWEKDFYWGGDDGRKYRHVEVPEFDIQKNEDKEVRLKISKMYEAPGLNLQVLMALAEFFGTKHINDDDRFSHGGCETCDYGSEYGFVLTIRPE